MKQRRVRQSSKKQSPTFWNTYRYQILAMVYGAVTVAVIIVLFIQDSKQANPIRQADPSVDRAFDMQVYDVASKFLCSCGSCNDNELASCTCPTAIEEKTFIDDHLKRGVSKGEVIRHVNNRYGHIKVEFVSLLTSPVPPPKAAFPLSEALLNQPQDFSVEDHVKQIASRFYCACKQCDHVLSECTCEHPRGAAETKAFIRFKIAQRKFTTDEIVKALQADYGHLIENEM